VTVDAPERAEAEVGPGEDPRVRARRIQVARDAGRRRRHRLVALATVLLVVAAAWGVTRSPLLSVQRIEVIGTEQLTRDAVVAASGVRSGQLMVPLDVRRAAGGVAALPQVARVRVAKRWPRSVRIVVVERRPLVAGVLADGTTALIDPTGRTIAAADAPPPGLLVLTGPVPAGPPGASLPPAAHTALEAVAALPPALAGTIVAARWADDGRAELLLTDDRSALVGAAAPIADQHLALATLLASGDVPAGATADVRVPRAPVVLHIPGATTASP
jgi:cell division protein FtsQ